MGPVDPGRVFWRAVRRNNNALNIIRRADIAIAADTICVHGDTPEAIAFAQKLRAELGAAGIEMAAPA